MFNGAMGAIETASEQPNLVGLAEQLAHEVESRDRATDRSARSLLNHDELYIFQEDESVGAALSMLKGPLQLSVGRLNARKVLAQGGARPSGEVRGLKGALLRTSDDQNAEREQGHVEQTVAPEPSHSIEMLGIDMQAETRLARFLRELIEPSHLRLRLYCK
jgi:hypothetical protein